MKYRLKKDTKKKIVGLFLVIVFIQVVFGIYYFKQYLDISNSKVVVDNVIGGHLELEQRQNFSLVVKSDDKYKQQVLFQSMDKDIVEIDKAGNISANGIGDTMIKVWIDKSKNIEQFKVTVNQNEKILTGIEIGNIPKNPLYVGENYKMESVFIPNTTDQKDVSWSSSNTDVVTISKDGIVHVIGVGNVTITLTGENGLHKTIDFKTEKRKRVISLTLDSAKEISLESSNSYQVKFKDVESSLFNHIEFTSSDKSVVKIDDNGLIQSIRPGVATIQMKSKDSKVAATLKVNVISSNGLLTQEKLLSSGINSAKKLMIVAHPDDETLWGGGHLLEGDWFVLCLTNEFDKVRKNEFYNAMAVSKSKSIILSYPDLMNKKKDDWSTVEAGIKKDLQLILQFKDWQQITTHNPLGDTGHIHHRNTNRLVTQISTELGQYSKLWYTGRFYSVGNVPVDLMITNNESVMIKKNLMLSKYIAETKPIDKYWRQMMPYEHWKKASEWN